MGKRGQLTLFVVLGIILVLAVALVIFFRSSLLKSSSEGEISESLSVSMDVEDVRSYIQKCLEAELYDTTNFVSLQGGYFSIPDYSLEYSIEILNSSVYIPYYLYYNQKSFLSKEDIQDEISLGLDSVAYECTSLPDSSLVILVDKDKITSVTSLKSASIESDLSMPIVVKKGDSESKLDNFKIIINSNLSKFYDVASTISDRPYVNGQKTCMTCIYDLVSREGLQLEMDDIEGKDSYITVYTLKDSSGGGAIFNFAHKFNLGSAPP
jgi:hypothetical protein